MTHKEFRSKLKISSEKAHKELFEAYCGYVYTIVFNRLRSCASREDIEECVCDVFADVYCYYDTEKEIDGDISGFIGTIARRKAAALYKSRISSAETVSIDDELSEQLSSEQDVESETALNEQRRVILSLIAGLGEPDSSIIIQKYYYGRSAREIADIVGLTPENIRVRSGRAVRKLKEMLEKADISL
ncbi:MAG: sigma-70 family RNA polymerase sigma factor [Ruminococcus sp.]|uniref:RNA polymerase sigma factor n=1 Tax=Ruminococcus sp. TaxID=41978 RepID=UPI0025E18FDE|nr:sigma-70 family RNA polymerase sigma factor [Ruminococcus sp.]MBR5682099.1 sigma-70 family RNA polymerase sigma factor [Ruminococcus sp.]